MSLKAVRERASLQDDDRDPQNPSTPEFRVSRPGAGSVAVHERLQGAPSPGAAGRLARLTSLTPGDFATAVRRLGLFARGANTQVLAAPSGSSPARPAGGIAAGGVPRHTLFECDVFRRTGALGWRHWEFTAPRQRKGDHNRFVEIESAVCAYVLVSRHCQNRVTSRPLVFLLPVSRIIRYIRLSKRR